MVIWTRLLFEQWNYNVGIKLMSNKTFVKDSIDSLIKFCQMIYNIYICAHWIVAQSVCRPINITCIIGMGSCLTSNYKLAYWKCENKAFYHSPHLITAIQEKHTEKLLTYCYWVQTQTTALSANSSVFSLSLFHSFTLHSVAAIKLCNRTKSFCWKWHFSM